MFRAIESLPFASESSELFDRPSINLGRILGGDALNKVPDTCVIDVDMRYLPEQDPDEILAQVRGLEGAGCWPPSLARRCPSIRDSPFVRALCAAAAPHHDGEVASVGRDGASDAVSFLRAGIPAVEFGPVGGGHHGPDEWVSVPSLASYRRRDRGLRDRAPGLARPGAEPRRRRRGLSERDGTPEGTEGEGRDEDAAAEPTVPDAPAEHPIPDAPQPRDLGRSPRPGAGAGGRAGGRGAGAGGRGGGAGRRAEEPEADAEEPEAEEPADADEEPEPAEEPDEESRGDTAEEDTVALADREQAQEAAMAGLRERAATEAARRKVSPATPTGAQPVAPAAEPKAVAAPPAAAVPVAPAELGTAPPRWGIWARFVSASFLIVVSMATATAVSPSST